MSSRESQRAQQQQHQIQQQRAAQQENEVRGVAAQQQQHQIQQQRAAQQENEVRGVAAQQQQHQIQQQRAAQQENEVRGVAAQQQQHQIQQQRAAQQRLVGRKQAVPQGPGEGSGQGERRAGSSTGGAAGWEGRGGASWGARKEPRSGVSNESGLELEVISAAGPDDQTTSARGTKLAESSGEPTENQLDETSKNLNGMWWRFDDRKANLHVSHPRKSTEVDIPEDRNINWRKWTGDEDIVVIQIAEGTGQRDSPFCVSYKEFKQQYTEFGFTDELLGLFRPNKALLEFRYSQPDSRGELRHMEWIMANYENDAFIAFLRHDLTGRTMKCILFVKTPDYQKRLSANDVYTWLEDHRMALSQHPLRLLSSILAMVQSRSCQQEELRREINDLESKIGVTKDKKGLLQRGYSEESTEFFTINQKLVSLSKKVANCRVSATTIITHTRAMWKALNLQSKGFPSNELEIISAELLATETRCEMDLQVIIMAETMLRTLSAVLYHRISKRDSESMITIAVVTTVFLPVIVVSAVFNSGVFDFFAHYPSNSHPVYSGLGWTYFLTLALTSIFTYIAWLCIYLWKNRRKGLDAQEENRDAQGENRGRRKESLVNWMKGLAKLESNGPPSGAV